jgi:hypothetical protein
MDKISYVIYPIIPPSVFRVIFVVCCIVLASCALFAPEVLDDTEGFSARACALGARIPMVRMLNWWNTCYLSISYGGAIFLGFVVSILYCFTRFPGQIEVSSIIPSDRKNRILMWFTCLFLIAGTWTFSTPPTTSSWKWSWVSSNRVTVSMFAPMLFGLHVVIWGWIFLDFSMKARKVVWKTLQKNNSKHW